VSTLFPNRHLTSEIEQRQSLEGQDRDLDSRRDADVRAAAATRGRTAVPPVSDAAT
jgi:hypothetical protein